MKKQYFDALWGPARRSERTPGEEKKRWGPRSQAGNLELAIRDGARDCLCIWHALLSRWEAADSMRGAQPAAPDVIEKNQYDSKLRRWVQQLMHIVHPAVVCKSYVQSIWNTTKIDPKSVKNRAQASQNPFRFDLAAPNRCQINGRSSQSQYLSDFGGAFWRSKYGENHLIWMKIQTAFQ